MLRSFAKARAAIAAVKIEENCATLGRHHNPMVPRAILAGRCGRGTLTLYELD